MARQILWPQKCPICGREFYPPDVEEWAYRTRQYSGAVRLYCSWHCLREEQRRNEKKKKPRPKVAGEIFQLLREGFRMFEIAEKLTVTIDTVKYWRERYMDEMNT